MKRLGTQANRCILLGAALLVVGCGGTGTVAGKANFGGKPLPGGLVTIIDSKDESHTGVIQKDGTYSVANVQAGKAKVTVGTSKGAGSIRNPQDVKEPYGPFVQIPKHYADPNKSGMSLDVKTGKQDFTIDLKEDFEPDEVPPK